MCVCVCVCVCDCVYIYIYKERDLKISFMSNEIPVRNVFQNELMLVFLI